MKKIFTLISVLMLISLKGIASGINEKKDDFKVNVTVISDLKIEVSPVDFGIVQVGNTVDTVEKSGEILITGEAGKNIKINLYSDSNFTPVSNGVVLRNEIAGAGEAIFFPRIILEEDSSLETKDEIIVALNNEGKILYNVSGQLSVPDNATSGNYSGQMTITVKYEN